MKLSVSKLHTLLITYKVTKLHRKAAFIVTKDSVDLTLTFLAAIN